MERNGTKRAGSNRGTDTALLRARLEHQMTVDELARRSGVSAKQIRLLSRGRIANPHLDTKRALAAALGIAVDEAFKAPDRLNHGGTALIDFLTERTNRGYSQQQMADEIGVTKRCYVDVELRSSRPHGPNALKFADYFGCSITDIWPVRRADEDELTLAGKDTA